MKPLPILLGGDLNCYSMALAFYEEGIFPSLVVGKYRLGVTSYSRFVRNMIDPRMGNDSGRIAVLREIAAEYPHRIPVVIGGTDEYASFLIRNKGVLGDAFLIPSPPPYLLPMADKAIFLEKCREFGIATPKTVVVKGEEEIPEILPFLYPAVLKPANSEEYWRFPFAGMRKVYFPANRAEAEAIRVAVRKVGYRGAFLVQERIPISDTDNYVLTAYADRFARVVGVAFGRVLMEVHTPKGLGNHAAILTEGMPPIAERLVALMESLGYRGFANFDLLRDPRSGELCVLEMNLRQGRSNHYMTAAGLNPAGLVLRDLWQKQMIDREETMHEFFWHSVPPTLVYRNLHNESLVRYLQNLVQRGRAMSPFHIKADLVGNPLRFLFVKEHERRMLRREKAITGGQPNLR